MKALVVSMSILLVVFFSFTPSFGQSPDANRAQPIKQKEEPAKELANKKTADANKVTVTDANAAVDANTAADTNAVTDPNAVRAEIKEFKGLSEALRQVDTAGKDEISRWTNSREEKLDLALAVQKQITEEFKFLRELAAKEGAAKTTAAIDGMLLDRQERFKDVIDKLEKEADRSRRERDEKRNKEREQQRERGNVRTREHPAPVERNK